VAFIIQADEEPLDRFGDVDVEGTSAPVVVSATEHRRLAFAGGLIEDGEKQVGLIDELVVEAARAHAGRREDVCRQVDTVVPAP